jgi:hypothetical protein
MPLVGLGQQRTRILCDLLSGRIVYGPLPRRHIPEAPIARHRIALHRYEVFVTAVVDVGIELERLKLIRGRGDIEPDVVDEVAD